MGIFRVKLITKLGTSFAAKYSRMDRVKFFKDCLPEILLGPFLNTLPHLFGNKTPSIILLSCLSRSSHRRCSKKFRKIYSKTPLPESLRDPGTGVFL